MNGDAAPPAAGPRLLQVQGLTSGYGRVRIVQEVGLAVHEGEVLAIIGRNGVGKTTLVKTLMGMQPAIGGTVAFEGNDITRATPHHRARTGMAYVPQGRGIFSRLTVRENLLMGESISRGRVTPAHYERIHGFFPVLRERAAQMAGTFSGGQQQQLALGRALLSCPKLLLLDEPSEGIQPSIVQEIGRLLKHLAREERLAVLVVEQNLELIRLMADRCLVIDKGAVVAELDPRELTDPSVAARYLAL